MIQMSAPARPSFRASSPSPASGLASPGPKPAGAARSPPAHLRAWSGLLRAGRDRGRVPPPWWSGVEEDLGDTRYPLAQLLVDRGGDPLDVGGVDRVAEVEPDGDKNRFG